MQASTSLLIHPDAVSNFAILAALRMQKSCTALSATEARQPILKRKSRTILPPKRCLSFRKISAFEIVSN